MKESPKESNKSPEKKLKSAVFFIEANSFEQQTLWEAHHKKFPWREDNRGFSQVIGYVNGRKHQPVNVSFSFARIHGQRVCFYYCCSRFSDSVMVENFLEKHYPVKYDGGTRRAMTDAANFHHAIHWCEELDNKVLSA